MVKTLVVVNSAIANQFGKILSTKTFCFADVFSAKHFLGTSLQSILLLNIFTVQYSIMDDNLFH